MVDIFPTGRFAFLSQEVDIERATLDGGETITGGSDHIATDGGGRVFAEFNDGSLVDRETVLAWRAALTMLEQGSTPMVVSFCDKRHQPVAAGKRVTYGDSTTHSDGTLFQSGGAYAQAVVAAPLRATTLEFIGSFGRELLGGEWFAIEHPTKGWRAYRVRTADAETGVMTFRPPLREAVAAETLLEFNDPRCVMVQDGRASAALAYKRLTVAAIRFVEYR